MLFAASITDQLQTPHFDPSLIRDYKMLMDDDFTPMVQFIAATYKHRMFREDDGHVRIEKEETDGFDYFYGMPFYVDEALALLNESHHPTHKTLHAKLSEFLD